MNKTIVLVIVLLFVVPTILAKTVPTDYNSVTGKCEWKPEVEPVCGDATYNPLTKMCEVFPIKTIICDPGFAYNAQTDKCEKYVDSELKCIDGTYADGKCIKEVEPGINNICTEGVLYQSPTTFVYSCIIEPDYQTGTCMSGSWNEKMNACVITPDLDYLCINGVLNENKTTCLITPKTVVICPEDTTYDNATSSCLSTAGGGGVEILCPTGSYYDSNTKRCIFDDMITADNMTVIIDGNLSKICNEGEIFDKDLFVCIIPWERGPFVFYVIAIVFVILLYALWEKGPKSGFIKVK